MNAPAVNPAVPGQILYKAEGPQPLFREISPGDTYPTEGLGPLREVVEAVADITQAPLAIAAQSALSVASLAVQGFANVETLGGDTPCSLFCLTIAESGERKSSCDRLLMRGIRAFELERGETYKRDLRHYDTSMKIREAQRDKLIKIAADKDAQKAEMAERALLAMGPGPLRPLYPGLTAQDPTFEGLLKLYQIGRPALGLFSDEAGSFLGGHAMNSDNRLKTIAGLSKLWDGDVVNRVRQGDGVTSYPGKRLATHLMAQPVVGRPLMADAQTSGQGFLARFLITEPPSAIGTRIRQGHNPASQTFLEQFERKLRTILDTPLPTEADNQVLAPEKLPLSEAAGELLWRFYVEVEKAQTSGGDFERIKPFASKAAEQAARIAGVLTLWTNLNAAEVTLDAMGWGVTLAQFYLGEARRLVELGSISEETRKAQFLLDWLLASWPHDDVTPSEILHKGPNQLRERAKLTTPLATLEKAGWLFRLPAGAVVRGATRKEAYAIVRQNHEV